MKHVDVLIGTTQKYIYMKHVDLLIGTTQKNILPETRRFIDRYNPIFDSRNARF